MAKVRVYELAKDLAMDSTKLVELLTTAGIDVKNYMSVLDDEDVVKAKKIILGDIPEAIEEKRITNKLIRRRKKNNEPGELSKFTAKTDDTNIEEEVEPTINIEDDKQNIKDEEPHVNKDEEELPLSDLNLVGPSDQTDKKEKQHDIKIAEVAYDAVVAEKDASKEANDVVKIVPPFPAVKTREEKQAAQNTNYRADIVVKKQDQPINPLELTDLKEKTEVFTTEPKKKEGKVVQDISSKQRREKKKKVWDNTAKIISRPEPIIDNVTDITASPVAPVVSKKIEYENKDRIKRDLLDDDQWDKKGKAVKKKKRLDIDWDPVAEFDDEDDFKPSLIGRKKKEVYERSDLYLSQPYKGRSKNKNKELKKQTEVTIPKVSKRRLKIDEFVTVNELAHAIGVKAPEFMAKLLALGQAVNINQKIDFETASLAADEFGYELELAISEEAILVATEDKPEDLKPRPPVVTIMGHVDHGKTTLLDYIRNTNVVGGESGGITQHIGAYHVTISRGEVVFLDTPGHEAFTAMRARGAKVTDIIVLVVAADDGVMPQTREAINHAKAAGIPIVVAVNKMDKPEANPDRIKRELADLDLSPEEWGGETIYCQISAKTGEGVADLLDMILLQSEVLELKGNPTKPARGTIIEAELDTGKGPVATVIVQNGTLHSGDNFVCGEFYGKVRAMADYKGKRIINAGPSIPVEIYGISGVPMAGDEFVVVPDEKTAKFISEKRHISTRLKSQLDAGVHSLDDLYARIQKNEAKELNLIVKTDVQGSHEALVDSLLKLSREDIKIKVLHAATGAVNDGDIMLASASNAIIIAFNVRASARVRDLASKEQVDIRYYSIIYDAVEEVQKALHGLLDPVFEEQILGHVLVREIFKAPKIGTIAGCYVNDGVVERNAKARLLRNDIIVFNGKISSLKRFKDDVREVHAGYECGITLENFNDLKPEDVIEVFRMKQVEPEL